MEDAGIDVWRVLFYIVVSTSLSPVFVTLLLLTASYDQQPAGRAAANTSGRVISSSPSSSSSSSSSPLPCDAECRRFRQLLLSWPAHRPKAAIVLLLQPSSVNTFARSSRLFSANFNDVHGYPVIVFHEESMNNKADRQRLRSLSNSSLYFQVCSSVSK